MSKDVVDDVQNDQEIEKIGQELGKKASKDVRRTASQAGRAIKQRIKKAWKTIPPKAKLFIIIALVVIFLIFAAVSYIYKLFGDNSISGAAVNAVISDNVKVVKAENNQGYYFKIDKEIIEKYKQALSTAYAEGWYDVDLDSMLDNEEDENSEEETEDEEKNNQDNDDAEFDDDDVSVWFKTDDKSQWKSYLVKMIKAHLASSYPELGYYYGEESDDKMDKRLDNRIDEDEDYVAQGTIKIKRTKMRTVKPDEQVEEAVLTFIPYDTKSSSYSSGNKTLNGGTNTSNKEAGREQLVKFNDNLSYYEILPEKMKDDLPLIVFLHGNGGCSDNCSTWLKGNASIINYVGSGKAYAAGDFVFIAPHAHTIIGADQKANWEYYEGEVMQLIEQVVEKYKINKKRIVLTGFSGGTQGVWAYVTRNPDYFSAAVPVSCSALEFDEKKFTTTPVWAISGAPYGNSNTDEWERNNGQQMERYVERINKEYDSSGNSSIATYQALDGLSHGQVQNAVFNASSPNVFDTQALFAWMLKQEKGNPTKSRPGAVKEGTPGVVIEDGDKTFKKMIAENDLDVLNYFSLELDKGLLWFATYSEEIVTENGEKVSSKFIIRPQSVDINSITSLCSMPFDFLFSLLQTSGNPEWVMTLIDLALQENDVVIMIQDQLSVSKTTDTYYEVLKTTAQYMSPPAGDPNSLTYGINYRNYKFPYGEKREVITTIYNNTATVYIQKAKTWCLDYEQEAQLESETTGSETIYEYTDEDYEEAVSKKPFQTNAILVMEKSGSLGIPEWLSFIVPNWKSESTIRNYLEQKYRLEKGEPYGFYVVRNFKGELKYSTTYGTISQKCTINTKTEKTINYKRFLGTWKNDKGTYYKGSLFDSEGKEISYTLPPDFDEKAYPAQDIVSSNQNNIDILLELLLRHEDTQIHELLMEYFWNIYTGEDIYDVDINELLNLMNTSISISNLAPKNILTLIRTQLVYWEGSGPKTEDGKYYIAIPDPGYGDLVPTIGPGLTKETLRPYGIDIEVGSKVEVEKIDEVFEKRISNVYEAVKKRFNYLELEDYQYAALTIVYYNYPHMMDLVEDIYVVRNSNGEKDEAASKLAFEKIFENRYKVKLPHEVPKYVRMEDCDRITEELRQAVNSKIYTEAWSKIYHSNGMSMGGLVKRRYGEWVLFQYGFDVVSGSYYSGSSIMDACRELTEILQATGNYRYPKRNGQWMGMPSDIKAYYYGDGEGYTYICCADYVAMVLYYTGTFDADTINKYYFHGTTGILALLTEEGWTEIPYSQAEPGDIGILTGPGGHIFFLWENNTIWDEAIGQKDWETNKVRSYGPYYWAPMTSARYFRQS